MTLRPPLSPRPHGVCRRWIGLAVYLLMACPIVVACGDDGVDWNASVLASPPKEYAVAATAPPMIGAEGRAREYKIKAALLFNFLKYAKFPKGTYSSSSEPIQVLIVGKDPFGPVLKKSLGKKKIGGRSIQIRRVKSIPKDITAQLIFTSGLKPHEEKQLIAQLKDKPSLLVGESPGFAKAGGFINLYLDKGKVRFEIKSTRQSTTRIKLKAELLKLARIVKSDLLPTEAER